MKSILRWIGVSLKYAAGVMVWMVVFAIMQIYCIFNINSFIDGLWMKNLHDGLVVNLTGNIAYRAEDGYGDYGCGDKYIYSVLYKPGNEDNQGKYKSLNSLVDVQTWKFDSQVGIFAFYSDSNHKYTLRVISDGTDMSAVNK